MMQEQGDVKNSLRGVDPLVYELFVLGELMVQPLYGYLLHEISDHILGPLSPLSWGILYPLIKRLEQEGLTTSAVDQPSAGFPRKERGQPRRIYSITSAGRERFLTLMLTTPEYSRDTPKLFIIKLTKFSFLAPDQRLIVLRWYRGYLEGLQTYYQTARAEVSQNPQIVHQELIWILRSIDYQLHRFNGEIAWIDDQITMESGEGR
jgi:DNA-binding PadR family transcriptional regulator